MFFTFSFTSNLYAQDVDFKLSKLDSAAKPSDPNTTFEVTTDELHYFNLQAPTKVNYTQSNKTQKIKFDLKEPRLRFSLNKVQLEADSSIEIEMYVCDKAKTYCLPKSKTYSNKDLIQLKSVKSVFADLEKQQSQVEVSTAAAVIAPLKANSLFLINEIDAAFAKAKTENKPLMIDFYGIWCPPCNVLDETIFNQKEFQKLAQSFVLLKVDADLKSAWDLRSRYGIKYLPTVVYATPEQEEIMRFLGVEKLSTIQAQMQSVLKNKNLSLVKKIEKVEASKDPILALEVAEYYRLQENTPAAVRYYNIASKGKTFTDESKDKWNWLTLSLAIENAKDEKKSDFFDIVMASLQVNPLTDTASEKFSYLKETALKAKENGDEQLLTKFSQAVLEVTAQNLKALNGKNNKMLKSDIYFMRSEAFEALGQNEPMKESYLKAAESLEQTIKDKKLDLANARGYNLDRMYALYKSGQFAKAYELYESYQKLFPEDFTFYFGQARAYKEEKKFEESLAKADLAYERSYGDNRLRVTYFKADLMRELKQRKKAAEFIDQVLKQYEVPTDESLSTFKHIVRLKKQKSDLEKGE